MKGINGRIVLPDRCDCIILEDMRDVEGGAFPVKMTRSFLKKEYCKNFGKKYQGYEGMTDMDIAKELYAHAVLSYGSKSIEDLVSIISNFIGKNNAKKIKSVCNEIQRHADVCDLGGDSSFRIKVFNAIWVLC